MRRTSRPLFLAALGLAGTFVVFAGCGGGGGGGGGGPMPTTLVTSGFDVTKDAFSFPNFGGVLKAASIAPSHLPRMYGQDKVCTGTGPDGCTLKPIAQQYLDAINLSMAGGRCEGFAILSGLMFLKKVEIGQFGAPSTRALSLDANTALGQELAYWYSSQYLKDVVDASTKQLTGAEAVTFLATEYAKPDHDMYRIGIVRLVNGVRQGGHAVLATGAGPDPATGKYAIRIYDNNHPEGEHSIAVDAGDDSWSYDAATDPTQPPAKYSGNASDGNKLYVTPVTPRLGTHDCAFCAGTPQDTAALNQLFGFGSAEVTATDGQGRTVGERGGKAVTDIPGSVVRPAFWSSPGERAPVVILFPQDDSLKIGLSGTAASGPSSVSWFGSTATIALDGAQIAPGTNEQLTITKAGERVSYAPSAGTGAKLLLGRRLADGTQALVRITLPTMVSSGGTLDLAIDGTTGNATVAPQGTGDVSLTVEVLRASATETSYFQGTVDVPAKGSATLDVQSWPGGSAPIDATVQQAGQPDAPVTLTNGASQPAATCDTKILRCGDHGVCSDANGTPHCECNLGYSGAACDVAVTDCAQNPCQHGGTCRGGAGAFSCKCPSGYGGPTCAIEVCTSDATCGAGKFCDGGACHTCEQADANRCGDASAPAGCHVCSGATPMCQAGACVCAADASCCTGKYCGGGACNACSLTDANHCGKASSPAGCTVCPAETPECSSGACVCCADASCGLGHYCASGACAACSQTDASHCGSSGDPAGCQVCSGPTPMCFMGACIPAPPNSYAIATTSSGLSGLYSNNGCPGIPRYQNDCSAPFGFVWTDAGLSGHTLTSMSVDFELTSCATPGSTHTVTLNGTPIGTFGAPPAGGTCCTQQTVSFVPTTLAPYVIGGSNTLMITGPGSCESLDDLGGTLATVSVHYSP